MGMGLGIYALKNYLQANQAIKNGTYMPKNSICCRPIDFRSCDSCLFDFSASLRKYKLTLLFWQIFSPYHLKILYSYKAQAFFMAHDKISNKTPVGNRYSLLPPIINQVNVRFIVGKVIWIIHNYTLKFCAKT
jgi:hypothetical protein